MYSQNHPERIKLNNQIRDWNSDRLDLFAISEPNEYLEFYGVMRFFYQGDDLKYQTKCLRVSSTATTADLIEALVIKFHPDLKMLTNDRYALYESHSFEERKMKDKEFPLIVQLNWAADDKDGKFILKNESRRRRSTDFTSHALVANYGMSKSTSTSALGNAYDSQTIRSQSTAVYGSNHNFLSKRFMSSKKSKRKGKNSIPDADEAQRMAAELSGKPPESSFTRTISNPDEVMKRRRQRKLESRLEHFSGDSETGGTLKIYGDSINPDIPYKTLLLSVNDTAEKVLSETLDKYGLSLQDHRFYVLVQNNLPKSDRARGEMAEEIILHDQDCPLGILVHCPPKRGTVTFAVRRRTPMDKLPTKPRVGPFSFQKESLKKAPRAPSIKQEVNIDTADRESLSPVSFAKEFDDEYPRLVKLSIDEDGNLSEEDDIYTLKSLTGIDSKNSTPSEGSKFIKIGSQPSAVGNHPNILLPQEEYPDIRPTHCHISAKVDLQNNSIRFTLTPTLDSTSRIPKPCLVYINQVKVEKSTKLRDEDIIQIGESVLFKFEDPDNEQQTIKKKSSNVILDHKRNEDTIDNIQINYLTADLPVTVKHSYNNGEYLIECLIEVSKAFADKGSKNLFGCNTEPRFLKMEELFRLAPAYTIYLVLRSGLGSDKYVSDLINSITENLEHIIEADKNSVQKEVYWLSNTSELLHLLQCDNDLRSLSGPAQDVLASAIEHAFTILQNHFTQDLMVLLPAFLDPNDYDEEDDQTEDIEPCLERASALITYGTIDYPIQYLLQTLSLAYTLFHNCQVNVALTIQMFSQLFHLLNAWLFNAVLHDPSNPGNDDNGSVVVSQEWGTRLSRRLSRIKNWSDINGLDMAANCHLQKMYQVVELMEADKRDLNVFGEKCLEWLNINGNQLHYLLENCKDYDLPSAWIEVVVNTAIQWHDQAFNDGVPQSKKNLPLYEDLDLRLPLLLPADGYCCDRGIVSFPKDLKNMLNSLSQVLSYKLNPPTQNEIIDTRWKSYLGPYENTPSVSRSNTLIEQSPIPAIKLEAQQKFPRNFITDESSLTLSLQDSHSDVFGQASKAKKEEYKVSIRPKDLPIEISAVRESDGSSDNEVLKSELKYRYKVKLTKINNSLGLSIIAARKSANDIFRIYIKDVIPNGAGYHSGKIETGDQLVSVDGKLLDNINQDEAVEFMKKTKPTVTLLMEKGAAQRHGVYEVILKSKSLKAQQKKAPVDTLKTSKSKAPSSHLTTPHGKPISNNSVSSRPLSRENFSKLSPVEIEARKRTEYKLPPTPNQQKAPPRPVRAPPNSRAKPKIEDVDVSEQDYHSLPIRKKQPKPSLYGTVGKNKSPRDNDDSINLQNTNGKLRPSSSQPNLAKSLPKKRLDSPVSSSSSSSGSVSTSEEDSEDNQPVKPPTIPNRTNLNLYTKAPPAPKFKVAPPKPPTKALSDNNIQDSGKPVPRYDNTGNKRTPKEQIFTRPAIAPEQEPAFKIKAENSLPNLNLKYPVKLTKKEKDSQSSSFESESETLSSATQSMSSDQSPQPQKKINSEPILSIKQNEPPKNPKVEIHNKIDNEPPQHNVPKFDKQLTSPKNEVKPKIDVGSNVPKVNKVSPSQPVPPKSFTVTVSPPPAPTAMYPQYHPPSSLEENTKYSKPVTEDEIQMRKKMLKEKFRQETDLRISTPSPTESRSESQSISENNKPNQKRNSQYGRPVFNDSTKLNASVDLKSPSSQKGIVIPASPVVKVQSNDENPRESAPAEELSFRQKIQLFAQKNGEGQVANRNKFSSKQRKIESGDYS